MNNLANLLGDLLADVATKVSNQALNIDPQLRARLQQLSGNTVEINCSLPASVWHLTIVGSSLQLGQGPATAPQVIVAGTAMDLAGWLFQRSSQNASRLRIEGDETLLLEIAGMLRDFEPDLQDPLGQLLGPQLATSVLGTAEMGLKGIRSMLEGMGRNLQQSPAGADSGQSFRAEQQEQLNALLNGIDELRLRVDRLAARVNEQENNQAEDQ
ncbi:MAG: SCP2 sterol-binding domain-containing protein [Pseudomonadota bacterium]